MTEQAYPAPTIRLAHSYLDVRRFKRDGVDAIVYRYDSNEVHVITKSKRIENNIRLGESWSMEHGEMDALGYITYVYTRLNEEQLLEHLVDPNLHKRVDPTV